MSDAQKIKDCIQELQKANKESDDRLNKIEENTRQRHQEQEAQSSRQS